MELFRPLNSVDGCLKCGSKYGVGYRYQSPDLIDVSTWGQPPWTETLPGVGPAFEWMERECERCGFTWPEMCADYTEPR